MEYYDSGAEVKIGDYVRFKDNLYIASKITSKTYKVIEINSPDKLIRGYPIYLIDASVIRSDQIIGARGKELHNLSYDEVLIYKLEN